MRVGVEKLYSTSKPFAGSVCRSKLARLPECLALFWVLDFEFFKEGKQNLHSVLRVKVHGRAHRTGPGVNRLQDC